MNEVFRPVDWIYSSNVYEVNLRQYTPEGTIAAFSRELPRLRDMGIEVLWFMPITPMGKEKRIGSLGSYYACSDYVSVNPEYGTVDDFAGLVKEAHRMGFKVLIDIVANHTAWDHRWTREHPEYYRLNAEGKFYDPNGWADVIDLNYDNPGLRKAMLDATIPENLAKYQAASADVLSAWRVRADPVYAVRKVLQAVGCEPNGIKVESR